MLPENSQQVFDIHSRAFAETFDVYIFLLAIKDFNAKKNLVISSYIYIQL